MPGLFHAVVVVQQEPDHCDQLGRKQVAVKIIHICPNLSKDASTKDRSWVFRKNSQVVVVMEQKEVRSEMQTHKLLPWL